MELGVVPITNNLWQFYQALVEPNGNTKKNPDEVWIKEVGKHEVILRPTNLLMSEEI